MLSKQLRTAHYGDTIAEGSLGCSERILFPAAGFGARNLVLNVAPQVLSSAFVAHDSSEGWLPW
jgi:hypothetical protein